MNNKFVKFNGHNPESRAAKERERKRKSTTLGVVKCCKCKSSDRTLYKTRIKGEEVYICKNCLAIMKRKARKRKFGE